MWFTLEFCFCLFSVSIFFSFSLFFREFDWYSICNRFSTFSISFFDMLAREFVKLLLFFSKIPFC
jgi:hypothetical protein